MIRISPAIRGTWALGPVFPDRVVIDGVRFKKALWRGAAAGVLATYRQDKPTASAHLKVLADRTWVIDHLDDVNPDSAPGSPLPHLIVDHPAGNFSTLYSYVSLAHALGLLTPILGE